MRTTAQRIQAQLDDRHPIKFNLHDVQPPSPILVTPDDQLQISYCCISGTPTTVPITTRLRLMLPDGSLRQEEYTTQLTASGSNIGVLNQLTFGFIVGLSVFIR